jgi:hypothetical protein
MGPNSEENRRRKDSKRHIRSFWFSPSPGAYHSFRMIFDFMSHNNKNVVVVSTLP